MNVEYISSLRCQCQNCCKKNGLVAPMIGEGGTDCCEITNMLLQDIINVLEAQSTTDQEGLNLVRYCDADGNVTGYLSYIYDVETASVITQPFDAAGQPSTEIPEGEPCVDVDVEYKNVEIEFCTEDGIVYVKEICRVYVGKELESEMVVWHYPDGSVSETAPENVTICGKDKECLQPMGECKCLALGTPGANSFTYENADNTTDISFSSNSTTIKWSIELGEEADADATGTFIADCIGAGNVASMTMTDAAGNTYTFDADTVLADGSSNGGWAFTGAATSGTGSGKLTSVVINCSGSDQQGSGQACSFYDCENDLIIWKDSLSGEVLTQEQVDALEDCDKECEVESLQFISCATEAVGPVSIGDQILNLVERDCDGLVVSSTSYLISTGEEITEPVLTEQCDPDPQIEEVRDCVTDAEGMQWTQIIVVDTTDPLAPDVIAEFFYDNNLVLGTPAGDASEWTACPNPSDLQDVEKVCFEYFGEFRKGFRFVYSNGEVQYGLTSDPSVTISGAVEVCCDDCIQVFGCRDGRLAFPAGSTVEVANGDSLDIEGLRYSEVAQLIVDTYGGRFEAPSLGGPLGANFSGCQSSSTHEIQLYNVPVQIVSISEMDMYGPFGNCDFTEDTGGNQILQYTKCVLVDGSNIWATIFDVRSKADGSLISRTIEDENGNDISATATLAPDCDCDCSCGETANPDQEVFTLFSKFSDPHPDASSYPGITLIGNLGAGSVHPGGADAGSAINGWNVFAVCASALPADDSNGHYWLPGVPSSFTGVNYTGTPASDPTC